MSHAFSVNAGPGSSNYISLAPLLNNSNSQNSNIYRAGRVRVSLAGISGGSTAPNGLMVFVRLVTLEAAPSNPGPAMLQPSPVGTPVNTVVLSTLSGQTELEVGQPYQKGFSADAQGKAVGTHLLCEGQIGDSSGNIWLNVEVD